MIETLICDWSGVVSDDTRPVYEANMKLLADHKKDRMSFSQWKAKTALTAAGFLRNCGVEADEHVTYQKYKAYFNEELTKGNIPQLIDGVNCALSKLSGIRKIVLSSHPEQNLRDEMQRYGLSGIFCFAVGSVTDKVEGLNELCNRFGLNRNSTVYIGDTIYDIQAARKAGLISCAVASGYHSRERLEEEDPDILIDEFSWFLGIV
jgi:phosphoglycolate phosphatase